MSESNQKGKSHDVLSDNADQDVEQPGDTPSDSPPNVEEADDTEVAPKTP